MDQATRIRVALICGGPSYERGISLNSARSAMDHLSAPDVEIVPFYVDTHKRFWRLQPAQLYSNTPSDFDFKLGATSAPLSPDELAQELQAVDIVFPVIHGKYGEDGEIQEYLEELGVEFIGSGSTACRTAFHKYRSNEFLREHGYETLPAVLLTKGDDTNGDRIAAFFEEHNLERAIVKPAAAGSSIGVFSVNSIKEALQALEQIFRQEIDTEVILEPFIEGVEFTMMVLENRFGEPVALVPTEVEIDYSANQLFDYRKKYLPTRQVTWHSPPRFDDDTVRSIQETGEALFAAFGMRDVARFDGWRTSDGRILFSDFNPVSGMEQNSFLFLQCAQVGMSHADTLRYLASRAAARRGIVLAPEVAWEQRENPEVVNILFGGDTAERQVSVMSGTNVWLKLRRSKRYEPHPYLLDTNGIVWKVPYVHALHHTVEEIAEACERSDRIRPRLAPFRTQIAQRLALPESLRTETDFVPESMTLDEFIRRSKLVFIGLHGGMGENGELQTKLEAAGVAYTGSGPEASRVMMDKYETGEVLKQLNVPSIRVAEKVRVAASELSGDTTALWEQLTDTLRAYSLIVKPIGDGCSAGVVRLYGARDLQRYVELTLQGVERIPAGTLHRQTTIVEMPTEEPEALLFEPFIETDDVLIVEGEMFWKRKTGWIEVTIGVLGAQGKLHAMHPSITVASGEVLTVEEKFQGGTGVNITPPPPEHVPSSVVAKARTNITTVANALGINGYARIDCFLNTETGDLVVIEANSLPGLTPSTVIYHQALAEEPPMFPTEFLEKILAYRTAVSRKP